MREIIERALRGETVEFTIAGHRYAARGSGSTVEILAVVPVSPGMRELKLAAIIHADTKVVETQYWEIASAVLFSPNMDEYVGSCVRFGETELCFDFSDYYRTTYSVWLRTKAKKIAEAFPFYKPLKPEKEVYLSWSDVRPEKVHEAFTTAKDERSTIAAFLSMRGNPKKVLANLVRNGELEGLYVGRRSTVISDGEKIVTVSKGVVYFAGARIPLGLARKMPSLRRVVDVP